MRENLYRGKCVNGEWVEGYYATDGSRHYIITEIVDKDHAMYGHYSNNVRLFVVIPETVGQYTGLCDKNGKKIFEGDIVIVTDDYGGIEFSDGGIGDVILESGMWYVAGNPQNSLYDLLRIYYLQVINSIHDNPELLKGGAADES